MVLVPAEKGESAPNDETPDQSMTLYGTWPKIIARLTTNPHIESDLKQVLRYSQNYNKSLTIVRLRRSPQHIVRLITSPPFLSFLLLHHCMACSNMFKHVQTFSNMFKHV